MCAGLGVCARRCAHRQLSITGDRPSGGERAEIRVSLAIRIEPDVTATIQNKMLTNELMNHVSAYMRSILEFLKSENDGKGKRSM